MTLFLPVVFTHSVNTVYLTLTSRSYKLRWNAENIFSSCNYHDFFTNSAVTDKPKNVHIRNWTKQNASCCKLWQRHSGKKTLRSNLNLWWVCVCQSKRVSGTDNSLTSSRMLFRDPSSTFDTCCTLLFPDAFSKEELIPTCSRVLKLL